MRMPSLVTTLVLTVAIGSIHHARAAEKPILKVFILAGQSNMAGADSEVPLSPGFQQTNADQATRFTMAPLPEAEQSREHVPWGEIRGHQAKNKLVHGPEVGFARTLYLAGWRDVAIIKVHIDATPIGRIGKPEELAAVIRFLASEESSFMTGQTVVASGGRVMLPG